MKKLITFLVVTFTLLLIFVTRADAQMMGFTDNQVTSSEIQSQRQEEQEGKDLLDRLNSKSISCQDLPKEDFEKIGEYFMGQSIGDISRHITMNSRMKSMMGTQGEEQVHITWGKRGSNCDPSVIMSLNPGEGGVLPMMGFYNSMMNWNSGWGIVGILCLVFWLVVFVDLVLLGVWLWKQIKNSKK